MAGSCFFCFFFSGVTGDKMGDVEGGVDARFKGDFLTSPDLRGEVVECDSEEPRRGMAMGGAEEFLRSFFFGSSRAFFFSSSSCFCLASMKLRMYSLGTFL